VTGILISESIVVIDIVCLKTTMGRKMWSTYYTFLCIWSLLVF